MKAIKALLGDAAARMRTCFQLSTDCLPEPWPPWNFSFTNRKTAVHFSGMETDFIPREIKTLAPTGSTSTRLILPPVVLYQTTSRVTVTRVSRVLHTWVWKTDVLLLLSTFHGFLVQVSHVNVTIGHIVVDTYRVPGTRYIDWGTCAVCKLVTITVSVTCNCVSGGTDTIPSTSTSTTILSIL
jgi:hypothetical protein